jgi:hypothetical protein
MGMSDGFVKLRGRDDPHSGMPHDGDIFWVNAQLIEMIQEE